MVRVRSIDRGETRRETKDEKSKRSVGRRETTSVEARTREKKRKRATNDKTGLDRGERHISGADS